MITIAMLTGISGINCIGQEVDTPMRFNRLNIQDGLISSVITDIVEDHDGFLWISTFSGLSRFDGTGFTNYHATSAPCGLANDHINDLSVGPEGNIYALTRHGWSFFNTKTQCFENFYPDTSFDASSDPSVLALFPDKGGIVWIGTPFGLAKFSLEKNIYTHFEVPPNSFNHFTEGMPITEVQGDLSDPERLVLAFNGGLCYFDKTDKSFQFTIPAASGPRGTTIARSLHVLNDSIYWNGSWGSGLGQYNLNSDMWSFFLTDQGEKYLDPVLGKVPWDVANGVLEYDENHVWIGYQRGLGVLSLDTKTVETSVHDPSDPSSISSNIVQSIVRGQSGVIYIGTSNGLNIYNGHQQKIRRTDPKMHMPEISEYETVSHTLGNLMLYCARLPLDDHRLLYSDAIIGGITILDIDEMQFEHLSAGTENGRPRVFYDYTLLNNGEVLLGSDSDLFIYDPGRHNILELAGRLTDTLNSVRMNRPRPVLTPNGDLFVWDTRRIVHMQTDSTIIEIRSKYLNAGPLINDVDICKDGSIMVWIGSNAFRVKKDQLVPVPMSHPLGSKAGTSRTIEDTLWIGSQSSGLYKYYQKGDSLLLEHHYTTEDGLPSNNVTRLSDNGDGTVWGTSLSGIFRINVESGNIRTYDLRDGIEMGFIDEPIVFFPDGSVVFDDRRYLYRLTPDTSNEFPGSVYISSLEFADSTYHDLSQAITLAPHDNTVTIRMGIIDHIYGPRDKLYYRLDGFDDNWQISGNDRSARYTNLKPKDYRLQVKARNPDGIYSDVVYVPFTIKPALYQRALFIPVLAMLTLGVLLLLFRIRMHDLRKTENRRMEHNKKIAELELKALRSQMNPHFMFNSLNSIKNYIQKAEPQKASEYLSNFAHLIRLTLQHSREKNVSLENELEALLLYIDLEKLRFREGFSFNCIVDETIDLASVSIPPMILQPYVENAIWHGLLHKEGERQLSLYFSRANGMLECSIEDNGIGRVKAGDIKSKSATRYKSMGMGITSDRLDILNKMNELGIVLEIIDKVDADNQPAGTRVNIKIPYESNTD